MHPESAAPKTLAQENAKMMQAKMQKKEEKNTCSTKNAEITQSENATILDHTLARKNDRPTWCGVIVVVWWCFCGGVLVVVFL